MLDQQVKSIMQAQPELLGLEDIVEKELLHQDILYCLHDFGCLNHLTFIGGTALRLCYGSNRLSEDLDFTAGMDFNIQELEGLDQVIQKHLLAKYDLNVKVHPPKDSQKQTKSYHVTIEKYPGRPDLPSQKIHIDISAYDSFDVEHRATKFSFNQQSLIAGLPIAVESLSELLADKLIAFAYRARRIKPRDVWDIVWILQQNVSTTADLIQAKLNQRNKDQNEWIALMQKHVGLIQNDKQTYDDFYQEMSRFVSKDVAQRTLKNDHFWGYVAQQMADVVQQSIQLMGGLDDKGAQFKM